MKRTFLLAALMAALGAETAAACKPWVVKEPLSKYSSSFIVEDAKRRRLKCVGTGRKRTYTVPHRARSSNCSVAELVRSRRPDNCTAGIRSDKRRFRAACFQHDLCYGLKGASRATCDRQFKANLLFICDKIRNRGACRVSANAFYKAVVAFGQRRFKDFQAASVCRR